MLFYTYEKFQEIIYMDDKKVIKIHNKSDKPDNIVFKENVLIERCKM